MLCINIEIHQFVDGDTIMVCFIGHTHNLQYLKLHYLAGTTKKNVETRENKEKKAEKGFKGQTHLRRFKSFEEPRNFDAARMSMSMPQSLSDGDLPSGLNDVIQDGSANYVLHHIISGMGARCDDRWTHAETIHEEMADTSILQQFTQVL